MGIPVPVVPSPKLQLYVTMLPSGSDEAAALNVTFSPGSGFGGEKVNEAVGGWFGVPTVTVRVVVAVAPRLSVTVRATV